MPFLLAFGLASVLTPVAGRLGLAFGLVDEPPVSGSHPDDTALKIHVRPVPVLGGVAVMVAALAAASLFGWRPSASILVAVIVALACGIADDARPLPAWVRVQFQISKFTPDEVALDVRPLLGPYGTATALPKAHQLIVTELAGKLRAIKRTVDSIESGSLVSDHRMVVIRLKRMMPSEFMSFARTQFGIPENQFFVPDGSLRMGVSRLR